MSFEDAEHPDFPPMPDETVLWRYLDLPKFLAVIEDQALHFTRSDLMADRWEGSAGPVNLEAGPLLYGEGYARMRPQMAYARQQVRQEIYLNCWHASEHESAAMWSLYQNSGEGIAIRTTWGALKSSLGAPWPIRGGAVNYVDYRVTFIPEGNLFSPFMHKRVSFTHEREVRLVLWSRLDRGPLGSLTVGEENAAAAHGPTPAGYDVPVDLAQLTNQIYVAPEAAGWYAALVGKVIKRYNLSWDVLHSDLAADPIW
jgi:hypothetical protein